MHKVQSHYDVNPWEWTSSPPVVEIFVGWRISLFTRPVETESAPTASVSLCMGVELRHVSYSSHIQSGFGLYSTFTAVVVTVHSRGEGMETSQNIVGPSRRCYECSFGCDWST